MRTPTDRWRWLVLLLIGSVMGVKADSAFANLVLNVRFADGNTVAHILPTDVGRVLNLQVFAAIDDDGGNNGNGVPPTDFVGLLHVFFSLLSDRLAAGGLSGNMQSPINVAPFDAVGSIRGRVSDLNGDGIADIGSTAASNNFDVIKARASSIILQPWPAIEPYEFLVHAFEFRVGSDALHAGESTAISAFVPTWATQTVKGANWYQHTDAVRSSDEGFSGFNNGIYFVGSSAVIEVVPEPAAAILFALGLAGIGFVARRASSAAGTLNPTLHHTPEARSCDGNSC